MILWLVGMMGTGKSAVGALVSTKLELDFIDTDDEVERLGSRRVGDIWREPGEEAFRDLESTVVARVAASPLDCVVATGGGAVMKDANRLVMMSTGKVIWLQATPATLASRLGEGEGRPLIEDAPNVEQRLAGVLEERADVYARLADAVVDSGSGNIEEVAAMVEAEWNRLRLV